MRIRTIKPEFWTDKKVSTWSMETRLCFLALLSGSDDHGRGHAAAERIAAELFPYDLSRDARETLAMVHRALATLSACSRIVLYRVGDEDFYQIENWLKHQKVDRPSSSRIEQFLPEKHQKLAYFEGNLGVSENPRETLANTRETLATGSGIRDQGSGIVPPPPREGGEELPGNEDPKRPAIGHCVESRFEFAEIPSLEEWLKEAELRGVPRIFAEDKFRYFETKAGYWTRNRWKKVVQNNLMDWLQNDIKEGRRDREGRRLDGTKPASGPTQTNASKPGRQPVKIDWSKENF